jgi:phosphomevalonate kinase
VHYGNSFYTFFSHQWTEVASNQQQELIVRSLVAARDAFLEIRLHMREMGIAAGVPVSPT